MLTESSFVLTVSIVSRDVEDWGEETRRRQVGLESKMDASGIDIDLNS